MDAGITTWLLVFFSVVVMDAFWTLYIRATGEHQVFKASVWSAAIMAVSGVAATHYVQNVALLIPAILGAFVGTYVVLKWKGPTS